jgi:hypothetical protein
MTPCDAPYALRAPSSGATTGTQIECDLNAREATGTLVADGESDWSRDGSWRTR